MLADPAAVSVLRTDAASALDAARSAAAALLAAPRRAGAVAATTARIDAPAARLALITDRIAALGPDSPCAPLADTTRVHHALLTALHGVVVGASRVAGAIDAGDFVDAAVEAAAIATRVAALDSASPHVHACLADLTDPIAVASLKRDVLLLRAAVVRRLDHIFACAFAALHAVAPATGTTVASSAVAVAANATNTTNTTGVGGSPTELRVLYMVSAIPSETFFDSQPTLSHVLQALYTLGRLRSPFQRLCRNIVDTFISPILTENLALVTAAAQLDQGLPVPRKRKCIVTSRTKLSAVLKLESLDLSTLDDDTKAKYIADDIPLPVSQQRQTASTMSIKQTTTVTGTVWKIPNALRFVFVQVLRIVDFWTVSVFEYLETELEGSESLSENVAYEFWDQFRPLLVSALRDDFLEKVVSHIASSVSPSAEHLDNLLKACAFEIGFLKTRLKSINLEMFAVDSPNDSLVQFVDSIDGQLERLREQNIYAVCRDILLSDDTNNVRVEGDLADTFGLLAWKSKNMSFDSEKQSNKLGLELGTDSVENEFCLPAFYITSQARSLVDLAYSTLEGNTKRNENTVVENNKKDGVQVKGTDSAERMISFSFFTARNVFALYRAIIPQHNAHALRDSVTRACLFYNDSVYIANHLVILGNKFKDQFSASLVNIATYLDMSSDFVREGQDCLEEILRRQLGAMDSEFESPLRTLENVVSLITAGAKSLYANDTKPQHSSLISITMMIDTPDKIAQCMETAAASCVTICKGAIKQAISVLDSKVGTMVSATLCVHMLVNMRRIAELCLAVISLAEAPDHAVIQLDKLRLERDNGLSVLQEVTSVDSNGNGDSYEEQNDRDMTKTCLLQELRTEMHSLVSSIQGAEQACSYVDHGSSSTLEALKLSLRYMLRVGLGGIQSVGQLLDRQAEHSRALRAKNAKAGTDPSINTDTQYVMARLPTFTQELAAVEKLASILDQVPTRAG